MAVVYNCFAHLESIARFPRPVGSCVFVLLARCRARLAWTYRRSNHERHSTAQHAIDAGARGHELLRRGGARPLPDVRLPAWCCFSWPFDALISTQARAAAHKLALADVVAWWRFELAAMPRARRRTGRVSRVLFLCLRPCGVALATRTWGGYGAVVVVEAAVRRYIQMKCLALLDGPFVVGHKGRVGRGKNADDRALTRRGGRAQHAIDAGADELGIELRSFYRTSPPAADSWVHRARYEVRFSASFAAARAAVVRRASTRRLDPAARGLRRARLRVPDERNETPSTRRPKKRETRRQGEAGPRARAEVQGGRREGVRQARAERRAARGRVGGHDGVRGPCPFLVCLFPSS